MTPPKAAASCVLKLTLALFSVGALLQAQPPATGTPIPQLSGQTLDGQSINLPSAASGKITLLLLGASKKAGDRTKPWKDHFQADFGTNQAATYYVLALLEGAPSFVRGMIRSSMRSGTPPAERPHVVTSTSSRSPWLNYFSLTDDSLPMVLVLDQTGRPLWTGKGEFNDKGYTALKAVIARQSKGNP